MLYQELHKFVPRTGIGVLACLRQRVVTVDRTRDLGYTAGLKLVEGGYAANLLESPPLVVAQPRSIFSGGVCLVLLNLTLRICGESRKPFGQLRVLDIQGSYSDQQVLDRRVDRGCKARLEFGVR